jgi:hypothetical protein
MRADEVEANLWFTPAKVLRRDRRSRDREPNVVATTGLPILVGSDLRRIRRASRVIHIGLEYLAVCSKFRDDVFIGSLIPLYFLGPEETTATEEATASKNALRDDDMLP